MEDQRYRDYLKINSDFWHLPYIGRAVNSKYEELFDHNGYYPSDDYNNHPEYSDEDIIVRVDLLLSDDNRVETISCSKFVDHGIFYKGSDDRQLNAHDIKVFKEVLDSCTDSIAAETLDRLKQLPLKEGWRIKRASEKSITLENEEGAISLPADYAKQVIDMARNAPDIKNNDVFWEINKKNLRLKYKDAIFALLYSFDHEHFPDVEFAETAAERIEREDKEAEARDRLVSVIEQGQTYEASKIINKLPEIPRVALEAAANKKDTELLEECAYKTNNAYDLQFIGEYAIEQGAESLLKIVAERDKGKTKRLIYTAYNNHRVDLVLILLKYGYTIHIRHDNKTKYDPEEILPLVGCHEVYFAANIIDQLYDAFGSEPIEKLIDNYHHSNAFFIKTDPDGYYDDETSALVAWLIDKRDLALIDLAVSKGVKAKMGPYSNEESLAIKVFNEGGELWEHAEGLFTGNISFSKCISDKNLKLLGYLVKRVPVTEGVLRKAIEDRANEEMLDLLIQHVDLSIPEKRPAGKLPIWYYGLRINNNESFECLFKKYAAQEKEQEELQEVYDHFVWHYHDPEKAKVLVKTCHLPEMLIKESELANLISLSKVLSLVENEYYKDKGKKESIKPHKVTFNYYDDHTWEVKGKPSRSKYDTPHVEDLHYLVSAAGDDYIVQPIDK